MSLGASALVVVLGGPTDLLTTGTLVDSKNYNATIPTFDVSYSCYQRTWLAASSQLPVHVTLPSLYGGMADNAAAQAAGGGDVTIGARVEMTFRRLFAADDIHNYFWKARLVRGEPDNKARVVRGASA